jgi:hypothetical protein
LKLKWSISLALLKRLAICLGLSCSASNASTKFKRIKSTILTSTGMVQQFAEQLSHMPDLKRVQVSGRSMSALLIGEMFVLNDQLCQKQRSKRS